MALAPRTVLTYPLNGANRDFTIPFEYLARKFVQVTLVGKDRKLLTLNIDYRFTQRTIVTTTKPWGPSDGYERIEIRRYTSATERLVDFSDGSILRAYDLNTSQVQSLHIAEEGRDVASDTIGVNNNGDLDARGRKIVNLADAVSDGDAVTLRQEKAWGKSALSQANRAQTEAGKSAASAAASEASNKASKAAEGVSKAAATQSQQSAAASEVSNKASEASNKASKAASTEAKNWATLMTGPVSGGLYSSQWWATESQKSAAWGAREAAVAKAQAALATTEANRSKTEANRSKTEADKLGNANQFVATLKAVDASPSVRTITWHGNWSLAYRRAYIGDASEGSRMMIDRLGLNATQDLRVNTAGQLVLQGTKVWNKALTGFIDLELAGPAGSQAVRLLAAKPILHWRSPAKMHAHMMAAGNGTFALNVYSPAGAEGEHISFSYTGSLKAPGTIQGGNLTSATTISCSTDLSVGRNAVVAGDIRSRGRSVMIGSSSQFVPLVPSGKSPSGKNRMTHNLGVMPVGYQLEYRCASADAGYSPGDRIFPMDMNYSSSAPLTRGGQIIPVDVNVCDYFTGGTGVVLINKTSGVSTTMTMSRWNVRVTAYGLSNA